MGIPKKAVERAAEKALEHGLTHAETCGGLKKYLDWLFFKAGGQPRNFRVYGDKVFIFQEKRLITVLNVPPEHRKQAARLQRKKGT